MRKTIKIKYIGFWDGFDSETFIITQLLRKHYNVQICDNPDYVICSCIGQFYEFVQYPQIRIEYIGENYIPDLNMIDYSISPYPIQFLDRCFCLPQGMKAFDYNEYLKKRSTGEIQFKKDFMESKTVFANFCSSHESENNLRGDFFKKLCEYKKVDSIGTYLNNTGTYVKFLDGTKRPYQKKCKFTLCFESTVHGGFYTEKITDAFFSDSIPVYYGDPYISQTFNSKAFIDVAKFDSFESAIEKIIELDNDDEQYLKMLNEPVLVDPKYPERLEEEFEKFLVNIFDQPLEKAYRRGRIYYPRYFESFVSSCRKIYYSIPMQYAVKLRSVVLKRKIK